MAAMPDSILTPEQRAFLVEERHAVLATISPEGRPRLVPICFWVSPKVDIRGRAIAYTPIDEKLKQSPDPNKLARVRDILVLPEVTLLVDRWSEDWTQLAWLRAYGVGEMLEPQPHEVAEHAAVIAELRKKYPQYDEQDLEHRPLIRVSIDRVVSWGNVSG
jgi:PPOX class probable F420-dependent enzyme